MSGFSQADQHVHRVNPAFIRTGLDQKPESDRLPTPLPEQPSDGAEKPMGDGPAFTELDGGSKAGKSRQLPKVGRRKGPFVSQIPVAGNAAKGRKRVGRHDEQHTVGRERPGYALHTPQEILFREVFEKVKGRNDIPLSVGARQKGENILLYKVGGNQRSGHGQFAFAQVDPGQVPSAPLPQEAQPFPVAATQVENGSFRRRDPRTKTGFQLAKSFG